MSSPTPDTVSSARILDGRRIAEDLLDSLKVRVDARLAAGGSRPGLAVVLVGGDPASTVYVRNKRRAAEKVGIEAFDYDLPAGTTEAALLTLIDQLHADPKLHGILVQLPLPGIPDANRLIHRRKNLPRRNRPIHHRPRHRRRNPLHRRPARRRHSWQPRPVGKALCLRIWPSTRSTRKVHRHGARKA